ncbi:MAG TPA: S8 family serine peptidase [Gaiellaceae bacterium]
MSRGLVAVLAVLAALAAAGPAAARTFSEPPRMVEVVVTLDAPPLAQASLVDRRLASATRADGRLDLRAPASVSYRRTLAVAQRTLAARIARTTPGSFVRWHYSVVANGIAVVVPASDESRLSSLPGVATVYPSVRYHALLDRSPAQIGAPALWGPGLATAGNGMKIGIIDDGIDQTHPFFSPARFSMPAGFPKGQAAYTTAKVIAARSFAPPYRRDANQGKPFDPQGSFHGTHVAGIAAGNNGTRATGFGGAPTLSGIAPNAYLGNYRVLTVPTPGVGLDGNSPEIAAGIEAAVRDGMNVINLSLGEPAIEPSRDIVVKAIDAAAAAGVVPVVAAGNDFDEFGAGSVSSPGSAPRAITAAAVTSTRGTPADIIADFSSSGPTPWSLSFKPDVSAPGVGILSSVPGRSGEWAVFQGTSMASPHVAGAAALLEERHPTWTVAQLKSALVLTGDAAWADGSLSNEASTAREGGGVIDLPRANDPKIFAAPTDVSLGLVRPGGRASSTVSLADAGGGAGAWSATLGLQSPPTGLTIRVPPSVTVPGSFTIQVAASGSATEREVTGFVVLTRGPDTRRIPFWFRVAAPKLGQSRHTTLSRTGTYRGDTRRGATNVSTYRYPEPSRDLGIPLRLDGPEQVFRVRITRSVANFGVAVLSHAPGASIQPRIVAAGDENRLVGFTALPLDLNPYLNAFGSPDPSVAAVLPARGSYDVVFDTPSVSRAGRFTFRLWIGDTTPPSVRLVGRSSAALTLAVTDHGSGFDPLSLVAKIDGKRITRLGYSRATSRLRVPIGSLGAGKHTLIVQASDFQESKNMEDVPRVLPNTRTFRTTFTIG